jgi:predicted lipid-binding transport protein (Tim44 family)
MMAEAQDTWHRSFNDEQRADQEQADREAWRAIGGILMGIITIGLCLSFLTIFLVTR